MHESPTPGARCDGRQDNNGRRLRHRRRSANRECGRACERGHTSAVTVKVLDPAASGNTLIKASPSLSVNGGAPVIEPVNTAGVTFTPGMPSPASPYTLHMNAVRRFARGALSGMGA